MARVAEPHGSFASWVALSIARLAESPVAGEANGRLERSVASSLSSITVGRLNVRGGGGLLTAVGLGVCMITPNRKKAPPDRGRLWSVREKAGARPGGCRSSSASCSSRLASTSGWVFSIPHAMMYGPQAALIAESFPGRLRYSGASLGYQLASVIAGGPNLAPKFGDAVFLGNIEDARREFTRQIFDGFSLIIFMKTPQ